MSETKLSPEVENFLIWAKSSLAVNPSMTVQDVKGFNLLCNTAGTYAFFKFGFIVLPTTLGEEPNKIGDLVSQRDKYVDSFKSFFKYEIGETMLYHDGIVAARGDVIVTIYISEKSIPSEIVNYIIESGAETQLFKQTAGFSCYYDLSTGNYKVPEKLGAAMLLVKKKALKAVEGGIFKPYKMAMHSDPIKKIMDQIIAAYPLRGDKKVQKLMIKSSKNLEKLTKS